MSLLMKSVPVSESQSQTHETARSKSNESHDEMTLVMKTTNTQISSMSDEMKAKKRRASASLEEMFRNTVEDKGQLDALKSSWTSDDELEIEGISQMTLHSFLLKAEELGKNITYTRTLKVEITD
ncbi:hypothetical protein [Ekhidna sp.]|uniref:hypothetical protein n=1 Tax=Ekhidna sp. TaxID=2608089 RepID=UPI003BACAE0C